MPTFVPPQLRRDASHPARLRENSREIDTLPADSNHTTGFSPAFRYGIPALFALLGVAAMAIDMPLARWIDAGNVPDEVKKIFDLAEVFAHGYGALSIVLAAWVLAPQHRIGLPRIVCGWVLAGLAANVVKMMLSRRRPIKLDDLGVTVFDTFHRWLPLTSAGSGGQAFPSGHTTSAVALAVGLAWLFPRGKWLFATFAVLAAFQRMASGYHYLSDTLWGAALGWFCAASCLPGGWLAAVFDHFEGRREGTTLQPSE